MVTPVDDLLKMVSALSARVSRVEAVLAGIDPDLPRLAMQAPEVAPIVAEVAQSTGVPVADIVSPLRSSPVVWARDAVAWVARESAGYSYPRIGELLGGRDHTTAILGYRRACGRRQRDRVFLDLTDNLLRRARERAGAAQ